MELDIFSKIAVICFSCFLLYRLYKYISMKPDSLSFSSLNKSLNTMGFLALGLIVFIAFIVSILKQG